MWWKILIATVATFGTVWFGRLIYYIAASTSYRREFILYGILSFICALLAVGFGIWAGWTWLIWLLD